MSPPSPCFSPSAVTYPVAGSAASAARSCALTTDTNDVPPQVNFEPWFLVDEKQGLVTALSLCGLPGTKSPADIGMTAWQFTKTFGRAFPGGGNACYRKTVFHAVGPFNVQLGRKGNSLIGAEEKDLFDKMTPRGMHFYYPPNAILYHIIPPHKLTPDYFQRLTYGIGVSERYRTLQISRKKSLSRLLKELIKWAATILLWLKFLITLQPEKGNKLVAFRRNVTRGLLSTKPI